MTFDSATASLLIEALPDPVAIVDSEGRLEAVNTPMRQLIPGMLVGETLALSLRSPDVLDAVSRALAGSGPQATFWRERARVERFFEIAVAPLFPNGDASSRRVAITLRDLTEIRRIERMRADFIANASHELRTPLASVLGFIETLQGAARDDPDARQRFLAIMRDQARRMSRLIDDLLSLSRIEQNEHLRPVEVVDLAGIVGHVIDTLAPLAREHAVRLELSAPERLEISGERDELVRVVENLIENAIKYGARDDGSPSVVEVALARDEREATLSVRDYGPGIAAEHVPRLTERFYRVDAGASRAKGGTGLGLAIVKHIVARHRGRLSIQSKPGDGALFRVSLPAQTLAAAAK